MGSLIIYDLFTLLYTSPNLQTDNITLCYVPYSIHELYCLQTRPRMSILSSLDWYSVAWPVNELTFLIVLVVSFIR